MVGEGWVFDISFCLGVNRGLVGVVWKFGIGFFVGNCLVFKFIIGLFFVCIKYEIFINRNN